MENKTIVPKIPFPRYTYKEIIEKISTEFNINVEFGEDISTEAYRKLGEVLPGYYYIIDWPTSSKPFYIIPYKDKPELTESFDLQKGYLELTSGGTRVHNKEYLEKRLEEKGLNPISFESHLRMFDFGMPPHAGAGLGIDRFITVLCGLDDIREAVMYPRTARSAYSLKIYYEVCYDRRLFKSWKSHCKCKKVGTSNHQIWNSIN